MPKTADQKHTAMHCDSELVDRLRIWCVTSSHDAVETRHRVRITSAPLLFESGRLVACVFLLSDICVTLCEMKLNNDTKFAFFFFSSLVQAAFRSGNGTCYHSLAGPALTSQIVIGLHFLAS